VYLDEFLADAYEQCEERPGDPSLKSLVSSHVKCLKSAKGLRPIVTLYEGEKRGKAFFVSGSDAYVLECEDVTERVLEDPGYAEVLAALFQDSSITSEASRAERVVICTLKRKEADRELTDI